MKKKVIFWTVIAITIVLAFENEMFGYLKQLYFEKYIYQKSTEYGYLTKNSKLEDFGERSKSLIALNAGETKTFNQEEYIVVVIGDSYTWGQGVKFEDTLAQVLERKLNKLRSTKVVSLAETGDSIIDYKAHYDWAIQQYNHVDLVVFSIVENDLIFNDYDRRLKGVNDDEYGKYVSDCKRQLQTDQNAVAYTDFSQPDTKYYEFEQASWTNPVNLCVLTNISKDIPKENTLFITMMNLYDSVEMKMYRRMLGEDRTYIGIYDLKSNFVTSNILKSASNDNLLRVLPGDGHPSKLSHELFSELIYQKLLNNKKFRFGLRE